MGYPMYASRAWDGVRLRREGGSLQRTGAQAGVAGRWALAFAHSACADGSDDRVCVCVVLAAHTGTMAIARKDAPLSHA